MNTPQPGIFNLDSNLFHYLEYRLDLSQPLSDIRAALKNALVDMENTEGSTNTNTDANNSSVVVAFGQKAWNLLQPDWQPESLTSFEAIDGVKGFKMPSTQRDVFFWVHSEHQSNNVDKVLQIQGAMSGVAELALDLAGFTYHDSRDLTGFVDGSANPKGDDRQQVALIPEGQTGAGGCFVLSQQWRHNLQAFHGLSQQQQEKVIGRTKVDSIELEGDDMPADSHVSRTDVKVDGTAMKVYRRSTPYGSATEQGLYFLSFACDIARFDIQLQRMFGTVDDGLHDKLLEYSQPLTSSYWFAPSIEDIEESLNAGI